MTNSFSPSAQEDFQDPNERKEFEEALKTEMVKFAGVQILARKFVSDEQVELKVRMVGAPEEIAIHQMLKVGNEWKREDSIRYDSKWDREGKIQKYTPDP